MKAPKHTPGPWYEWAGSIRRDNGDDSTCVVAELRTPYRRGVRLVRGEEESQANARLIAAAPDLLAALIKARETMNHMGDALNEMDAVLEEDEPHFAAFDLVDDALKKAGAL